MRVLIYRKRGGYLEFTNVVGFSADANILLVKFENGRDAPVNLNNVRRLEVEDEDEQS